MMEVEYRREMNRNYMVIRPEMAGNEKYTMRMLSGNRIQGLLPFQDKVVDGEVKYYYDITSKQPLKRVLEHRNISGNELRVFMTELLFALKQMERFLLDEGQIVFQPEYIYVDPGTFQANFCLVPGMRKEFAVELCELSQYLLDHVNHSDGEAVVLAFSIFRECRKLNFGLDDIEQCLSKQECVMHAEQVLEKEPQDDISTMPDVGVETKSNVDRAEPEKERVGSAIAIAAAMAVAMLLLPIGILLWSSVRGLYRHKWILIGMEILLLVGIFVVLRWKTDGKEEEGSRDVYNSANEKEEPWEIFFRDEEEDTVSSRERNTYGERVSKDLNDDDGIETVLLSARPIYKECRKLVSVSDGTEIQIGYFPFIIGKNRDLTDHILNKPGVSRLHVKLEETNGGYFVTDLNSTNGTSVNGRLLEANETTAIAPGDELVIAAERFYFR